MLTCSSCKENKNETEFHYRKTEKRYQTYCKICLYNYQKERWIQRKIDAVEHMGGKCVDCQIQHNLNNTCIFDFHHLSNKDYDWTKLRLRSWESILKELSKCVLLCGNCHRLRHYN